MEKRNLSVWLIVAFMVMPMALVAIGTGAIIIINQLETMESIDRLVEKSVDRTRNQLSDDQDDILSLVNDRVVSSMQEIVASANTNAEAQFDSAIVQMESRVQILWEKHDDLRSQMESKGWSAMPFSVDSNAQQSAGYPQLSYNKSQEGDYYEYGAYLSGECTVCHKISREFTGIPIIFGIEESYFVGRLNDYKSGKSTNEAMASVARSLDDEMMLSLALFFKNQTPTED